MLVQTTVLLSKIWFSKTTKKTRFSFKKMFWVFFSFKNWAYWFWRAYCEISAHNDVPNLFSILNCLFAMNWNPVLSVTHTPNQAALRTLSNVEWGAQPRVQHYQCSQQGLVWVMGHWHYSTAGIFYHFLLILVVNWPVEH